MRTLSGHQLRPGPRKDDDPGLADLRSLHSAVKSHHEMRRISVRIRFGHRHRWGAWIGAATIPLAARHMGPRQADHKMEINPSPYTDQVQKVCFPLPTATYTAQSAMAALRRFGTSLKRLKRGNSSHSWSPGQPS